MGRPPEFTRQASEEGSYERRPSPPNRLGSLDLTVRTTLIETPGKRDNTVEVKIFAGDTIIREFTTSGKRGVALIIMDRKGKLTLDDLTELSPNNPYGLLANLKAMPEFNGIRFLRRGKTGKPEYTMKQTEKSKMIRQSRYAL